MVHANSLTEPEEATEPPATSAAVRRRRPMLRLVLSRLFWLVVTLLGISVLTFLATHALPGDPAQAILGQNKNPARLAELRAQLGLDRPLAAQYFSWLGDMLRGDFGTSAANGVPVSSLIGPRIANSFVLLVVSALIAVPLSIWIALVAAANPGGLVDRGVNGISLVVAALPEFVVGIFLIVVFSTGLFHWLPAVSIVSGAGSVLADPAVIVLPTLTLVIVVMPYLVRLARASAREVFDSEYVRAAQLRGVVGGRLLLRHVLPNAAPPTLQATVLVLVYLLGGVVIVETLFNFPGIGLGLVEAVRGRDLPTIQALALLIAAFYLILTTVADLATIALTPRLRSNQR